MYGIYTPHLSDLVDHHIEKTPAGQEPAVLFVRGLTTGNELVSCGGGVIHYLSLESVRDGFAEALKNIEKDWRISLGPLTDRDVIDSFISGVFVNRAARVWNSAEIYIYTYDSGEVRINVVICGGPNRTYNDYNFFPKVTRTVRV